MGNASNRDVNVAKLHLAAPDCIITGKLIVVAGEILTGGTPWVHIDDNPDVVFVVNNGVSEFVSINLVVSFKAAKLFLFSGRLVGWLALRSDWLTNCNMLCLVNRLLHIVNRLLAITVAVAWGNILHLLLVVPVAGIRVCLVVDWLVGLLDWSSVGHSLSVAMATIATVATIAIVTVGT